MLNRECFMVSLLIATAFALSIGSASAPAANGRIYFTGDRGHGNSDIFSVGTHGGAVQRVVKSRDSAEYWTDVSFDGSTLIYVRNSVHASETGIFKLDLATGVERVVARSLDYNYPAFAAGDRAVVFSSSEGADIWRSSINGSDPKRIARSRGSRRFENPEVSADGRRMVVDSSRNFGGTEIVIMDARGRNRTRLTKTRDGASFNASFSPNGRRIVFERFSGDHAKSGNVNGAIYSMAAGGHKLRRLTSPQHDCRAPVFSPNGERIAFVRDENAVYTMHVDGSRKREISPARLEDINDVAWASRP